MTKTVNETEGFSERLDAQLSEAVSELKTTLLMIQNQRTLKRKSETVKNVLVFNELRVGLICDSLKNYATSKEKNQ